LKEKKITCEGDTPVCKTEKETCVGCLANYASGSEGACQTEEYPVCNTNTGTCEACSGTTPYWNGTTCVECTDDSHCADNPDGKTMCDANLCTQPIPEVNHWTFCGYPGFGVWTVASGGPYDADYLLEGFLYYADDGITVYVDNVAKFSHTSYNFACSSDSCAKYWSVVVPKGKKWHVTLYNGGKNLGCAPGRTWLSRLYTEEECYKQGKRYFKDGICSLCPEKMKANADYSGCVCDDGFYMSNGACYSCSDKSVRATTEEACYATCAKNTRMWSNYNGHKYCFDCSYTAGVAAWFTKAECDHCPNRYFKDGKCSLCPANASPNADHTDCVCNDGYYMSNGACYSCSDKSVRATTEEACYATCAKNSRMWSNYNGHKYCFDCSYTAGVAAWFTKAECDHCPNRYFKDGKCALCPSGKKPNVARDACE
ncbi:MAG: hypothetical protein J6T55_01265, partial [Alphaproteobacteria bacterium]|nr:hypothetical protein [Alphaproteobacteria bacterium]